VKSAGCEHIKFACNANRREEIEEEEEEQAFMSADIPYFSLPSSILFPSLLFILLIIDASRLYISSFTYCIYCILSGI
jgi:hypothetical protein